MKQNLPLVIVLGGLLASLPAIAADFSVVNSGATAYAINGTNNPALTLMRGQTYTFSIAATGHPFWIKTNAVTGTADAYNSGVTGNGTQNGTLTFAVPWDAPDALTYICQIHFSMRGTLLITNPPPTSALLSNPLIPGPGAFRFDVSGTPRRLHSIEASSTPTVGWTVIGTTNAPPSGVFTFTDTNTVSFPTRFYRVATE
jgi:hypothetical protein